jgi:hypothetical protein
MLVKSKSTITLYLQKEQINDIRIVHVEGLNRFVYPNFGLGLHYIIEVAGNRLSDPCWILGNYTTFKNAELEREKIIMAINEEKQVYEVSSELDIPWESGESGKE